MENEPLREPRMTRSAFDPADLRFFRLSTNGGRATPLSVIIAVIKLIRRHIKRRIVNVDAIRRELMFADVRHFHRIALFDRNLLA